MGDRLHQPGRSPDGRVFGAAALGQVTTPAGAVVNELGGAWSTYWYNGVVYESESTKGLNLFKITDSSWTSRAMRLDHLNPQTQEFSLP